jgi:hypothetical protein
LATWRTEEERGWRVVFDGVVAGYTAVSTARESDWRWLGDLEDKADERGWLVVFDGIVAGGCMLRTRVLFSCAQIESVTEVGRQLLAFFVDRPDSTRRTNQAGRAPRFF